MKWSNLLLNNFWAKVISLALAVATWFYVFDLVNSDSFSQKNETVEDIVSRLKFIVKELPVKPVFSGRSPAGYRVVFEKVKINPSKISVFGPEEILGRIEDLQTDKINLGEYTRSVRLILGLSSEARLLKLTDRVVDVYLPVEAIEMDLSEKEKEEENLAAVEEKADITE